MEENRVEMNGLVKKIKEVKKILSWISSQTDHMLQRSREGVRRIQISHKIFSS